MKKLILILLAIMVAGGVAAQQLSKKEQRAAQKQSEIQNVLHILQSGQFKVVDPTAATKDSPSSSGYLSELDAKKYKLYTEKFDSVNSTYTIRYKSAAYTDPKYADEVVLYTNTGFGYLNLYKDDALQSRRTIQYYYIKPLSCN